MFSSKLESPYKRIFFNFARRRLKIIRYRFYTIFEIIVKLWKVVAVHKVCKISSTSKLQEHKGFKQSWKLWRNLCSLRWLKTKHKRIKNYNPVGSKILQYLLWTGRDWIRDRLWVSYAIIKVEPIIQGRGEKRVCETIRSAVEVWNLAVSCSDKPLTFWN